MRNVGLIPVAASFGLAAALAAAQGAGAKQSREFVQAAASSDQFEILAAQTALAQSSNSEVRDFAARMLEDHRQLGNAVSDAAARSGLTPPEMAMGADQAQLLAALQSVGTNDFDTLYLKQQMLAHHAALAVQQLYAKSGDDPALRQLATSTVQLISSHAEMAKEAATKLGIR